MSAIVYLLHFSEPYPAGARPRHYLGVAHDLAERLREHARGSAKSRLTRACHARGIAVALADFWKFETSRAAFDRERELKARKRSYSKICPLCEAEAKKGELQNGDSDR